MSQVNANDQVNVAFQDVSGNPVSVSAANPLPTSGTGGGGGGAVTIADGADVTQGSTGDALGANTVIGQLKKIASAGGSAVSIADGSDVAEGATADAAIVSDAAGTVSGKLRGLVKIFADVWDSLNHRLNVAVGNFPASQTVAQATGSNLHVVVDTAPSTAVTNAGLTNLDVALSTRTKPADQQHTIIDSASLGTVTISGAVGATLAAETTKVIGTVNQGTSPWVTSTTLAAETTKVIGTVNISSGQAIALAAGAAVIGHVIVDSGSIAAAATLAAETTKVIGTVNISSGQSIALAAGAAVIGHVIVDASAAVIGHVIVDSAGSLPLPTGASTNASLIETHGTVAAGVAATKSELVGAVAQITTVPAATDGQQVANQSDAAGNLRVNPFGNQGSFKTIVSTGAGNTTRTITVPAGKRWEFIGGNIAFVVANSGAARPIGFNFSDAASKVVATVNAGVSAPINATSNYTFGPGLPLSTGLTSGAAQIPCPSLALGASFTFNCAAGTGAATDTITVVLNVIEYPD